MLVAETLLALSGNIGRQYGFHQVKVRLLYRQFRSVFPPVWDFHELCLTNGGNLSDLPAALSPNRYIKAAGGMVFSYYPKHHGFETVRQ